jgi:PAS domain S-box-containing protein
MPPGLAKIHGALMANYHRTGQKTLIGQERPLPIRKKGGRVEIASVTLSEDDLGNFVAQIKIDGGVPIPSKWLKMRVGASESDTSEVSGSESDSASGSSSLDMLDGISDEAARRALKAATLRGQKAGLLRKKGGMFGKWSERFFAIAASGEELTEYKNPRAFETQGKPAATYTLSRYSVKLASGLTGLENSFALFPTANADKKLKPLFLASKSHPDTVEWFAAIAKHADSAEGAWTSSDTLESHFLDATVASSGSGIITNANEAACTYLGWKRSEIVGQPIEIMMPPGLTKVHGAIMQRYAETNTRNFIGKQRELPVRKKDGSIHRALLSLSEDTNSDETSPWKYLVQIKPIGGDKEEEGGVDVAESLLSNASNHFGAMIEQLAMFDNLDESTDDDFSSSEESESDSS